jgi:internalin A
MTPEEAYEEALRRIREAEEAGAVELVLSGWNPFTGLENLNLLPPELERLTSLQSLNLFGCSQLSGDLSPLAGLRSLKTLHLSASEHLSGDLSPLAGLTSLQMLYLGGCKHLSGDLTPLAGLTSLQVLDLGGCSQLSGELTPLASLTSLQKLDLSWSPSGDLSPLASLTSLQSLKLSGCGNINDLSPLANLTSLQSLNLSNCNQLSGDLSQLAVLTSLRSLHLCWCYNLSEDLSPLSLLTSLQMLDLSGCDQFSDLSPLAGLNSLQSLYLSNCTKVRNFSTLEPILPHLQKLTLYGCRFDDLQSEICGQFHAQNVIREVRAHYTDLGAVQSLDAELKLFILGNGGVGKTQLSRRLQGLVFDPEIPTTHGIALNFVEINVNLERFRGSVRLNLWDFGGQEIYHGSHTLFLHGQAIFLLLWNPDEEKTAGKKADPEHRPMTYWLDYLRSVAGTDNPLIIVQSQCDESESRADVPVRFSDWPGSA